MRYARTVGIIFGAMMLLTLTALGLYIAYVTRLWYDAASTW